MEKGIELLHWTGIQMAAPTSNEPPRHQRYLAQSQMSYPSRTIDTLDLPEFNLWPSRCTRRILRQKNERRRHTHPLLTRAGLRPFTSSFVALWSQTAWTDAKLQICTFGAHLQVERTSTTALVPLEAIGGFEFEYCLSCPNSAREVTWDFAPPEIQLDLDCGCNSRC